MGYDCLWGELSAKVLLDKPTESEEMNKIEFHPRMISMEYKQGDLPGLFESVREHGSETLTVNGTSYVVRNVEAFFDGETYKADLIPDS